MRRLSGEPEDVFFYARRDAEHYDAAEELAQPCIDLIHDTMVDLVDFSLTEGERDVSRDSPFSVLDVASGTGAEAMRLLDRFSRMHIVAVDFSPPMNDLFRLKLADHARGKDFASRVSFVEEDFFCDLCAPEQLQAKMPDDVAGEGFDAVIAGLFLHHYGADVKAEFFGRARAALKPGGVLVLCEAMAFDSPSLSQFAHDFGDNWIRKQFSDPDQHLRPKRDSLGADAGRLRDEWLYHWNHTHIYATDVHLRSAREPRNREPSYTEMAHDAGFRDLGLPFRFWEVGVLWARS